MGFLKKIGAKIKSHKNAGDRHQGRKSARIEKRKDRRKTRRDAKMERIKARQKGKSDRAEMRAENGGVLGGLGEAVSGIFGGKGDSLSSNAPIEMPATAQNPQISDEMLGRMANNDSQPKSNTMIYIIVAVVLGAVFFLPKLLKNKK